MNVYKNYCQESAEYRRNVDDRYFAKLQQSNFDLYQKLYYSDGDGGYRTEVAKFAEELLDLNAKNMVRLAKLFEYTVETAELDLDDIRAKCVKVRSPIMNITCRNETVARWADRFFLFWYLVFYPAVILGVLCFITFTMYESTQGSDDFRPRNLRMAASIVPSVVPSIAPSMAPSIVPFAEAIAPMFEP